MPTNAPSSPKHLVGSKWSAQKAVHRRRHWIVVGYSSKKSTCILEAVLDDERMELPWRDLRDREKWHPGWTQCDPEEL